MSLGSRLLLSPLSLALGWREISRLSAGVLERKV